MIKKVLLPILLGVIVFPFVLQSQPEEMRDSLIQKVESYIREMKDYSKIKKINRRVNYRRIKIRSTHNENSREMTTSIKYFKGGLRKERIKITMQIANRKVEILELILINDKYERILFNTYKFNGRHIKETSEEYVRDKFIRKRKFKSDGKVLSTWEGWF